MSKRISVNELEACDASYAKGKAAALATLRSQVVKLRDEAESKHNAIINYDAKQYWLGIQTVYNYVLALIDGEVSG